MATPTLKIENARFILTLDPRRRIIQDGSIVIGGQRITHVGKAHELASVAADRVIDGRPMVITPGFYNGHMHISYAHAVRGIFPDDVADRLLTVFQLQSMMNEEEEYYTSLLAIVELLKNGNTCFVEPGTTKYPDACMQAYEDSGCRIILGEGLTDMPDPKKLPRYSTEEAVSRTESWIKKYDRRLNDRVRAWAMPFSALNCTPELLKALKKLADEYGTGMTLHHSLGAKVQESFKQKYGKLVTEFLEALGVLGPNVLLAHVMGIEDAEIDCLARTGANVVMCPSNAIKQAKGIKENGRMPEMLAKGINVALGSDSVNSSNHLDIVRSMNLAACLYKDARQDTTMVPAEQALEMGTIIGARAFGLEQELGSIEVGKKADLVLFDTHRPEWRALFNPVNNLIYSADGRSIHTVIVDGRIVVEGYRQTFTDEWRLMQKVQEIGESLLARSGVSFSHRWPVV
ncbi:MAG: amidohydrolase [Deltaproteobacteria bacterium]|nr:amidohydrolase [Deltaproteobacteria bacterium]